MYTGRGAERRGGKEEEEGGQKENEEELEKQKEIRSKKKRRKRRRTVDEIGNPTETKRPARARAMRGGTGREGKG